MSGRLKHGRISLLRRSEHGLIQLAGLGMSIGGSMLGVVAGGRRSLSAMTLPMLEPIGFMLGNVPWRMGRVRVV